MRPRRSPRCQSAVWRIFIPLLFPPTAVPSRSAAAPARCGGARHGLQRAWVACTLVAGNTNTSLRNCRKEPGMGQPKESTPQVDEIRPYLRGVAKHLIDTLYGPAGPPWGTSLTQIEDLLLEVRD